MKGRLEIPIDERIRKKENILRAIKIQDSLSKKSGSWNGTAEIRKWREEIVLDASVAIK